MGLRTRPGGMKGRGEWRTPSAVTSFHHQTDRPSPCPLSTPRPSSPLEGPRAPLLKCVTPKRIKNSSKQQRDINIAKDPARLESPRRGQEWASCPQSPKGPPIRPPVTPGLLHIPQVLPGSSSPSEAVNYHLREAGMTGLREGKKEGECQGLGHLWDHLQALPNPGTGHHTPPASCFHTACPCDFRCFPAPPRTLKVGLGLPPSPAAPTCAPLSPNTLPTASRCGGLCVLGTPGVSHSVLHPGAQHFGETP